MFKVGDIVEVDIKQQAMLLYANLFGTRFPTGIKFRITGIADNEQVFLSNIETLPAGFVFNPQAAYISTRFKLVERKSKRNLPTWF